MFHHDLYISTMTSSFIEVKVAANWDGAEVVTCMHGSSDDSYCNVIKGTKVRKMHTSRRDAFRPINCDPYAKITYPELKIEKIDLNLPLIS